MLRPTLEGDAIVAWSTVWGQVNYVYRPAGGVFGASRAVSGEGSDVHVAMNASGQALVVWRDGRGAHGVLVAGASARPVWFAVASGNEDELDTDVYGGIDARGDVFIFWMDSFGVRYSERPAGGSFSAAREIVSPPDPASATSGYLTGFSASVAANGDAIVGWTTYLSADVATATPKTAFQTTVLASKDDPSALDYDPQLDVAGGIAVATNATGDAVASWVQFYQSETTHVVLAATGSPDRGFHAPQLLAHINPMGGGAPSTIDPEGRASVVWTGVDEDFPHWPMGVFSSTSSPAGVFGPAQTIENVTGGAPCAGAVASDDQGDVYVVWNEYDGLSGGCYGYNGHEMAAIRDAASGTYGPVTSVAAAGTAFPPATASQGTRGAIAAWPVGPNPGRNPVRVQISDALLAPQTPASASPSPGFWLFTAYGNVYPRAGAKWYGSPSASGVRTASIVGMAATADGRGYWLVSSSGAVYPYGDAARYAAPAHAQPIAGIAAAPYGGYWLFTAVGNVYPRGAAAWYRSPYSNGIHTSSYVGMAPTADGAGYWLASPTVGVATYGDAQTDPMIDAHPYRGITSSLGGGHWLFTRYGNVYNRAGAGWYGSPYASGVQTASIVGMAPTADGAGYWLASSDATVYGYGDATSVPVPAHVHPIAGIAAVP